MKLLSSLKSFSAKHKILTVFLGLLLLMAGFLIAKNLLDRPADLAENFIYVGRTDHGNIFGFDQYPSSAYYFATTVSKDDLTMVLSKAGYVYDKAGSANGMAANYSYDVLAFTNAQSHQTITLSYYNNNIPTVVKGNHLRISDKPFVVSIDVAEYSQLSKAIRDSFDK